MSPKSNSTEKERAPFSHASMAVFWVSPAVERTFTELGQDRLCVRLRIEQHQGGIAKAIEIYRENATPNVLIVELSSDDPNGALAELDALADYCDPDTKVMVLGRNNDVGFYRSLISRGVREYVLMPFDVHKALDALYRMIGPAQGSRGRCVAFIGAQGGVGSSMLSHHVALHVAETLKSPTLLIDLDLAFGTAGLTFDRSINKGSVELLFATRRELGDIFERVRFEVNTHLNVIGTSGSLFRTFDIERRMIDTLVQHVRSEYPLTFLDVPHNWTQWVRFLLADVDDIVLTMTPDIPSLKNARAILSALNDIRPNSAPPTIVVNKAGVPKRLEISIKDIETHLSTTVSQSIPFGAENFGRCVNEGKTLFAIAPKSNEASAIINVAKQFLPARTEEVKQSETPLNRLFKALQKPKKAD
jgi:pilus assembly protein CpaE